MTEAEWLISNSPKKMFVHIAAVGGARKLRLFGCACCRAVWEHIKGEACRRAVEVGERYSDGTVTEEERATAEEEARNEYGRISYLHHLHAIAKYTASDASVDPRLIAGACGSIIRGLFPGPIIQRGQAAILRCLFGNPFRPVTFDSSWRTSTAVAIAQSMYDSRDFTVMSILADALQDAGCESTDILEHCRGLGPHVRGCWVVDLVLSKS